MSQPAPAPSRGVKVGVLALQGAFNLHEQVLNQLGVTAVQVRTPEELAAVDRLIIPGGESSTISKLLDSNHLADPLADRLADDLPVLGTCAGLILLATEVLDGYGGQHCFGAVDMVVRRNGYGRQSDSFTAPLLVLDWGTPFSGVFIRAPVVESVGDDVEVLAALDGRPVMCRQNSVMVSSFHPELAGDNRIHRWFTDPEWPGRTGPTNPSLDRNPEEPSTGVAGMNRADQPEPDHTPEEPSTGVAGMNRADQPEPDHTPEEPSTGVAGMNRADQPVTRTFGRIAEQE